MFSKQFFLDQVPFERVKFLVDSSQTFIDGLRRLSNMEEHVTLAFSIFPLKDFEACGNTPIYLPQDGTRLLATPLHLAAASGKEDVLTLLLGASNVNSQPQGHGITALSLALYCGHHGTRRNQVYRLIRKYMKSHDKARVEECLTRLSPPKQVSLKGLLKRPQLVHALDVLIKFPGVLGGLQLGNIHKYLALHCDENFSFFLQFIHHVWKYITDDDPHVNAAVDVYTVQCLQFRAPITSHGDRLAINRIFDEGTLLEGIEDLDLRDRIRNRVLSVQIIIPNIETFRGGMKYLSIGAKILRKNLMEVPICKRNKPTLFESLAAKWKNPGSQYVECENSEFMETSEAPTAWHA
ncbi:hypothetical protein F66182_4280 [Fusarium sp. NRRL 66182]|nr:hypothetical protein F66182_4280 [Fusarium sp. NRRL 66182]